MGAKPKPARVTSTPKAPSRFAGKPPKSASEPERKRAERLQAALYRISDCANSVDDLGQLYKNLHSIIGELTSWRQRVGPGLM